MADGNLTPQEMQSIEAAIDNYGVGKDFFPDDAKDFFCKNWPKIKEGLEFLEGILPPPGPALIKAVIWIGDKAHASQKICPTT